MEELDFILPEEEKLEILKELIKTRKRETKLEEECKSKLANCFGKELDLDTINTILKKNGFNGIYILDDKEYESLFPGSLATYSIPDDIKAVFISKTDSYRVDALCHEMVHALIGHRMQTVTKMDVLTDLTSGLEEGIATAVAMKAVDKQTLDGYTYFSQVKLAQQLNALYNCNENKKYSNFYVHAILEPKNVLPLVKDIYSGIVKKYFKETKEIENIEYRTSFNLVLSAHELLDGLDNHILLPITQINYLYYSLANVNEYFEGCSEEIRKVFLLAKSNGMADDYDRFIYRVFGKSAFQTDVLKRIEIFNNTIPNYIEEKDSKVKRR